MWLTRPPRCPPDPRREGGEPPLVAFDTEWCHGGAGGTAVATLALAVNGPVNGQWPVEPLAADSLAGASPRPSLALTGDGGKLLDDKSSHYWRRIIDGGDDGGSGVSPPSAAGENKGGGEVGGGRRAT
eukprot:7842943-Pyramimonas_sp.AAC.1